ncbi:MULTISPECIES: sulfotransferase [unclassified Frankia]|uniref:sulfotransferase family protein n=1 Tax=unclassified Frankia TaxID=2632575 RepID=UPI001933B41A|nr:MULTISPECIES: sulfotransferase [unclassified Frankia]MBL7621880.1 sulfotransferase [Frankia sp. AgB1.8]
MTLDVDQLVESACEAAGSDDFGEDAWKEGLDRLVDALRSEADLNDIGVTFVGRELKQQLVTRLGIVAYRQANPEVAKADVVPPVVIVGHGRTGTTILHDLMAQDPAVRAPLTWEVERPCPPPETATYDRDPRIDAVEARFTAINRVMPALLGMHPMGARLAQECVCITTSDFRSTLFGTQYRIPGYLRWLLNDADMAPAYRWHRQFLQHLQARHSAQRWVLKSPGHIWCLGALLDEYPEALLIQTHRDPLRTIASSASMFATLQNTTSSSTNIRAIAAEWADYILEGLDRSVIARQDGTVPSDRIVDVHFGQFIADPFVTIRTVYEKLGFEFTPDIEGRMRAFLADNQQGKHGGHRYAFAETGLDEGELRERARRYQEYFDVPSEGLQ